jgi:LacI family transcriptional regulator
MGYWLDHFWLREPGVTQRRLSQILYHRGIRGLLFAPLQTSCGHFRFEWNLFCSVVLSYSITRPALHFATSAQFQAMRLAWHHLRHYGYRRIGLALRKNFDSRVLNQWQAAHLLEQSLISPRDRVPSLLTEKHTPPDQMKRWICQHKPQVIISIVPEHVGLLESIGFRVPDDIGLALLDLSAPTGYAAGIFQQPKAVGAAAMDLLHSLIERNETGIPSNRRGIIVEGKWIDGRTVRVLS